MKKKISIILSLIMLLSCVSLAPASAAGAKTLELVTDPVFDGINAIQDGLALAYKDGQPQYIDETGKVVISHDTLIEALITAFVRAGIEEGDYSEVEFYGFRDGLALARYNEVSVYFDKTGKTVATAEFGYEFSEGFATSFTPEYGRIMLINKKGEVVADKNYVDEAYKNGDDYGYGYGAYVHDGLIDIRQYDEYGEEVLCGGYLNTKLEIAIPMKFENVRAFNNGLAFAMQNGKWGVINTKGEFVIQPQFDDFWIYNSYSYASFFDGLAAVEKDGKWGYIDMQGNTAVPFTLKYNDDSSLGFFKNGFAYLMQNGKYGYIDKTGKEITGYVYDDANFFNNGVALVGSGGKYKLIDETGQAVSSAEWDFEGTSLNYHNDEFMMYKQNGKWGIMKLAATDAEPEQPSAWAVAEVTRATELGLVTDEFTSGYTRATTRAEFCALGVRLYETITGAEIEGRETFPDTNDVNVQKLASLGIVNGMDGGVFSPNTQLTREQAATIIARLLDKLGKEAEPSAPDFTDNGSFGEWSYDAIGLVQSLKIMNGRDNGSFDPKAAYTRQECILTMLRTFDSVAG